MSIQSEVQPAQFADTQEHYPRISGNSMDASIPYSTRLKWFLEFPIDREGKPTSDAAYRIIRYLFENRQNSHASERMGRALLLHPELVWCICRQLEFVDVVLQDPAGSGRYRYALASRYSELQAKVEVSLIDGHAPATDTRDRSSPLLPGSSAL